VCYGHQAIAIAFGGTVETGMVREEGRKRTNVDVSHPLFGRVKGSIEALFTHGDFVTELPEGFDVIGEHTLGSGERVVSAMAHENFMSVQFHPEVFDDTPLGYEIFRGFLDDVAGIEPDESLLGDRTERIVAELSAQIAELAGDSHVAAFASGGIDSTVATILAKRVIDPDRLHITYFDNGFMRDEDDDVIEMLQGAGLDVAKIDATESFEQATIEIDGVVYGPLVEVSDPKIKRKIIGNHFAELKDEVAASLGLDTSEMMLLQGTNAADRIESGTSLGGGHQTEQIKEHHNQVQAIKDLEAAGLLIEPLNRLYKDEIRRIGEYLGLPEEVAWRQPFPGPGNAIRIICGNESSFEAVDTDLQQTVEDFVANVAPGLSATLLPTKSVGVGGDSRTYVQPVVLQGAPDWVTLDGLSRGEYSIPEQFRSAINRVVYALGPAPVDTLSLTNTTLGRDERAILRRVDSIMFSHMRDTGTMRKISQCPVILIPFGVGNTRSIVLRPFVTSTYMTGRALRPAQDVDPSFVFDAANQILAQVPEISQVFLELTDKPPATTEWE
jgi:GMP synthase (glutamine-hydrolysing)